MASKMIAVREDVYNKLQTLKKQDESFSELLERLIGERKKDPLAHFGLWKEESKQEKQDLDDFEESLQEARRISRGLASKKYNYLEKQGECN